MAHDRARVCNECGVSFTYSTVRSDGKGGRPPTVCSPRCRAARKVRIAAEHYRANADEKKQNAKTWAEANPEKTWEYKLRHKFGLSRDEYEAMLADQDGRCAICLTGDPGRYPNWHVDHDHATGRVRGLLCGPCNRGLGHFQDNIDSLQRAISYLTR